uniref:Endoplasmic reticulum-Golgi intermediate compartment protein n=1 Tax=Macaca fascicularis TaxID=9541 RepID=A0A7N9DB08_MACFA
MGCAERHFPAAGGEWRVASVRGTAGGAGRPEEALAAGSDPRGAVARLACSAPTPAAAARCPLTSGVSICCCLFILFLFLSELTGFITTEVVNELYVDDPDKDSGGKIDVSLNISLPNLHCELVGLDIQDEMGRHEVGHIDNSMKIPLNNGAGCRFEGQFSINKVPGNFHVSTHSATAQPQNPDMTHVIHKLSFGDTLQVQNVHGAFNALGGADRLTSNRMYPCWEQPSAPRYPVQQAGMGEGRGVGVPVQHPLQGKEAAHAPFPQLASGKVDPAPSGGEGRRLVRGRCMPSLGTVDARTQWIPAITIIVAVITATSSSLVELIT